jgi:hypothetical protein
MNLFEMTMPVSITTSSTTDSVAATTFNVTTSSTTTTATTTNVTTSSTTNPRNRLESIPESGEIPDPVLQSTAITDNTSNSLCNTERSSRSSRSKRELSYMDSSNVISSKRSRNK